MSVHGTTVPYRTRRLARERAVQFLFGLAFTGQEWEPALDAFWEAYPARPAVKTYARQLIEGVCCNVDALDAAIVGALQHWAPARVGRVEWAILQIALYEMRHVEDVPRNVAINEAIEVSKSYGADDAPRFINGILDRLKDAEPDDARDGQSIEDD